MMAADKTATAMTSRSAYPIVCIGCARKFSHSISLVVHLKVNPECTEAKQEQMRKLESKTHIIVHRTRRTIEFKCTILDELINMKHNGVMHAQKLVAQCHQGVSEKNVSEWYRDREKLLRAREQQRRSLATRSLRTVSMVWYPEAEDRLYMNFYWRRQQEGLETHEEWLIDEMRQILTNMKPMGWEDFKCSDGWIAGFKKRYGISSLVRTNKKEAPIQQRLPNLRYFHRQMHHARNSPPERCAKYGRFRPDQYWHMDQIPLAFAMTSNRSLSESGAPVFISQPHGSGLSKRQASIILTIRAAGVQSIRPTIIFRGMGQHLKAEEQACYTALSDRILVRFQPKAWADGAIMLSWLDDFGQSIEDDECLLGICPLFPRCPAFFFHDRIADYG
jgi:hypothetical protein